MHLTDHAKERIKERDIPKKYIPLILKVGTPKPAHTAWRTLYETLNFGVVTSDEGVVTAFRRQGARHINVPKQGLPKA